MQTRDGVCNLVDNACSVRTVTGVNHDIRIANIVDRLSANLIPIVIENQIAEIAMRKIALRLVIRDIFLVENNAMSHRRNARKIARYGVACPFPQEDEIVRPNMTIFNGAIPMYLP